MKSAKTIEERLRHFREQNRKEKVEAERNKIRKSLLYEINLEVLTRSFELIECPELTSNPVQYILQHRYALLLNPVAMTGANGQLSWKISIKAYTSFWKYIGLIWDDLLDESINLIKKFTLDFIKNHTALFLHESLELEDKLLIVFSSISTHLDRPQKNSLLQWLRGMEALDTMESLIDWANSPPRITFKNVYIAIEAGLLSETDKYKQSAAKVMVRILKYSSYFEAYEFELKQPKVGQQLNFALRSIVTLQRQDLWLALFYILQSNDEVLLKYAPDVVTTCSVMMNRSSPNIVFGSLQLLQLMSDYKHPIMWDLLMGPNLIPVWLLNSEKHKIQDQRGVSFRRSYYIILRNLVLGATLVQLQQISERYINGEAGIPERMFNGISQKQKDTESRLYVLDAMNRMVFGDEGHVSWQESLEVKFQKTQISKQIRLIWLNSSGLQYQLSSQIYEKLSRLQRKRLESVMKELEKPKSIEKTTHVKMTQQQKHQQQEKRKMEERQAKDEWLQMLKDQQLHKIRRQQEKKVKSKQDEVTVQDERIQHKNEEIKKEDIKNEQRQERNTSISKDQRSKQKKDKVKQEPKSKPQITGEQPKRKERKPREKKAKTEEPKRKQE